jgi:hypothetical protein
VLFWRGHRLVRDRGVVVAGREDEGTIVVRGRSEGGGRGGGGGEGDGFGGTDHGGVGKTGGSTGDRCGGSRGWRGRRGVGLVEETDSSRLLVVIGGGAVDHLELSLELEKFNTLALTALFGLKLTLGMQVGGNGILNDGHAGVLVVRGGGRAGWCGAGGRGGVTKGGGGV